MKKRTLYNSISIFFTALFAGFFPFTACAKEPSAITYVALGDSITQGTGMDNPSNCFVQIFGKKLQEQNTPVQIFNYGHDGDTIKDTLIKINQPEIQRNLKDASYITVTSGGNDLLQLASSMAQRITGKNYKKAEKIPKIVKSDRTAKYILSYINSKGGQKKLTRFYQEFASQFHELLSTLTSINPDAVILLQTIYNPASGSKYETLSQCIDTVLVHLNAIISDEVYERNTSQVRLLDTYHLFDQNSETYVRINSDDIHPTVDGHALIAEKLWIIKCNNKAANQKANAASSQLARLNVNPDGTATNRISSDNSSYNNVFPDGTTDNSNQKSAINNSINEKANPSTAIANNKTTTSLNTLTKTNNQLEQEKLVKGKRYFLTWFSSTLIVCLIILMLYTIRKNMI